MSTQDLSGQEMMGMGAITWRSIEDSGAQLAEKAGKVADEVRRVVAKAALEVTLKALNSSIVVGVGEGIEESKKQLSEATKQVRAGLEAATKQAEQVIVEAKEDIEKGVSELVEPLSKLFPTKEEGISEDPWLYSLEAMSLVFTDNQGTVGGSFDEFKHSWAEKIKDHFENPGSDESINAWIDQATAQKDVQVSGAQEVSNAIVLGQVATLVREKLESGEPVALSRVLNEAVKSLRVGGDSFGVTNYAKAEETYNAYKRKLNIV